METRSATRRRKSTRKPLSDRTNTVDSQHSSSSSVASTSIKTITSSSPAIAAANPAKPQKSTVTASSFAAPRGNHRKENAVCPTSSTSVPSRGLNPSSSGFNKHQNLITESATRDENSTSTSKTSRVLEVSSSVPAFNVPQNRINNKNIASTSTLSHGLASSSSVPAFNKPQNRINNENIASTSTPPHGLAYSSSIPAFNKPQNRINNENIASTSTPSHGLASSSSVPAFLEPENPTALRSTVQENAVFASTSTSTPSRAQKLFSDILGAESERYGTFTIYKRRESADKRKGTCDPVAFLNFNGPDDAPNQLEKLNEVTVTNQSTSTAPAQKKQRKKAVKKEVEVEEILPQDFVEKQKAYFAEIDAFELSEEEVASGDELD